MIPLHDKNRICPKCVKSTLPGMFSTCPSHTDISVLYPHRSSIINPGTESCSQRPGDVILAVFCHMWRVEMHRSQGRFHSVTTPSPRIERERCQWLICVDKNYYKMLTLYKTPYSYINPTSAQVYMRILFLKSNSQKYKPVTWHSNETISYRNNMNTDVKY